MTLAELEAENKRLRNRLNSLQISISNFLKIWKYDSWKSSGEAVYVDLGPERTQWHLGTLNFEVLRMALDAVTEDLDSPDTMTGEKDG